MLKCITRQDSLATIQANQIECNKKKILVLGDGNSGKTTLINRFIYGQYDNTTDSSSVSQIYVENTEYGGQPIELRIHDSTKQEDYSTGTFKPSFYSKSHAVIVCVSIDSLISLENVSLNWLPEIRHFCGSVPIILVGTKSDIRSSSVSHNTLHQAQVTFEDGCAMAYRINAQTYLECSSKLDKGIEDVFHEAVKATIHKQKKKRFF